MYIVQERKYALKYSSSIEIPFGPIALFWFPYHYGRSKYTKWPASRFLFHWHTVSRIQPVSFRAIFQKF